MPPEDQTPQTPHQPPNHLPASVMPPINMAPPNPSLGTNDDLLEPDEQELAVVHRHPIGIAGIYLESLAGLLLVTGLLFAIGPNFFNDLTPHAYNIAVIVIIFGVATLVLFLLVA